MTFFRFKLISNGARDISQLERKQAEMQAKMTELMLEKFRMEQTIEELTKMLYPNGAPLKTQTTAKQRIAA